MVKFLWRREHATFRVPYENVLDDSLHESFSETFNLQLNGGISHNEVVEAISHLKQNKAGGPDILNPEIFIHFAEIITPFLVGLFSQVSHIKEAVCA